MRILNSMVIACSLSLINATLSVRPKRKADVVQQLHAVHSLGDTADLQHFLAQFPIHIEADKGIAAAGRREFFHSQVVQQLPAGSRLFGLGLIGGEAGNKGFQFGDFIFNLFVLLFDEPLHHLAGFVPEFVVAHVHFDFGIVNVHDMGADIIEEVAVMGNHDNGTEVLGQKVLQPRNGINIQMVGRLVHEDNIRIAEQSLCQQDFHLFITGEVCHLLIEQFFRQTQPLNQLGSVGFRLPAVQFSEFRFQFRSQNTVLLGKILLGIEGIFLLHDVVQPLVAHNNGIQNGIGIIGEVILFEDTHAEIFRNGHFTGSRFQLTAENFQECGFSGTVAADDSNKVASFNFRESPFRASLFVDGSWIKGFIYVFDLKHCSYLRVLLVLRNIFPSSKALPGIQLLQVQTAFSEGQCRYPSR